MIRQHFIIGSRWMKKLFPNNDKIQRRCKPDADYDVLVNTEPYAELKNDFEKVYGSKTELHYIPELWHYIVANPKLEDHRNILFTLKCSHVMFSKELKKKTFYDIFLMSSEGCTAIEPLFFNLYKFWIEKYGSEPWRADFTKESSDFFNDAVSRENEHDELHKRVAYYDKPAFKFVQEPNQTTVWVCPEKFWAVSEHIRQRVIIEEAQTLALERHILPKIKTNRQTSYVEFVEGLIDRLAPLWMVPYICNNFNYFVNFKEWKN